MPTPRVAICYTCDVLGKVDHVRYPWKLGQRLATRIETCQRPAAHADLDQLLAIVARARSGGLSLRKLRCAQLVSLCLRGAHAAGAPSNVILDKHLQILDQLAGQRTWKAMMRLMHGYVDELIDGIRVDQRTSTQRLVQMIHRDMKATPDSSRTLQEYAQAADVSLAHLSRAFTAIVGVNFREELRRLRIERAQTLLKGTTLKVAAVGRRVGINDPSGFVHLFKSETGLTPGQFRQLRGKSLPPRLEKKS